uniref:TF-B3 domain-containing protein n=1 Tax=Vitis vinifera TaxID=29760 RepID=A5ANI6_VITVI|nr:hypothetical protein VITISV_033319 [Vitis vinifera]
MSDKGDSASFPDEEKKKKKKKKKKEKRGSSSASFTGKDQSFGKMNRRTLLYQKSLTLDDVTKFKIMIPLESGIKFLAEPEKIDGKYQSKMMLLMDHDQQIWPMEVSFEELSSSYVLCLNWDKYFRRYELEAEDVIFLYFDPEIPSFGHFLIEYEKKGNQDDINSQTKKMGPSSSSAGPARRRRKDQPSSKINKRTLLYKKSLTHDDVSFCRLMIPLESGRKFLPEPKKYNGVYEKIGISFIDHEGDIWRMEATFEELSSSYMLWLNWDRYLKIFELEPADVIFFYDVPDRKHYLIEYEKKGRDSNPTETT